MRKNSLKTKLVVSFVLIILVTIAVVGASALTNMRRTIEQEAQNTLLFLAEAKEGQVFAYLDSLELRTIDFSSDGFIRDSLEEITTNGSVQAVESLNQHLIKNKQSLDPTIGGIMVIDLNGKVVAATDDKEIGKDESGYEYVIKGKKGIFVIELKEHTHFGLDKPFVAAAPLTDKETNETLGVIVNVFDTTKLSSILSGKFQLEKGAISASFERTETLAIYLVNKEKEILAHSHLASIHEEEVYKIGVIDTLPVQKCFSNKEEIVGTYLNHQGEEVVGASMCFPQREWVLLTEINTQEIFAPLRNTIYGLVIMLIFVLLFVILDVFLIAEKIINPIKKLHEATDIIAQGNLDYKIDIKTGDEAEQLAESFNKMVKDVLSTEKEKRALTEEYAKKLEKEVEEKTFELQSKVKELSEARLILQSLAEDVQKEKEAVEIKVKERTKEFSEEHGRLSSLVQSVKLGVIMVDLSLNVVLANPAAKNILGKSPSEDITFKDLDEKMKDTVKISQALSYYVQKGHPFNIQEVMIGNRYFRLFMSPVRDAVEKIFIGAVIVIEDITEQKKLDTMRTEIVSITSHQLRTPLSVIKGNLEMVLEGDIGKITKEQKEVLEEAFLGNERMIKLVNDLMDVSKIEEGKFKLILESTQLDDLAAEVVKEILPFAEKKHVSLSYVSPSAKLPKVKIDRQRIKRVLQNLIDNAIRYSQIDSKGKITVEIQKDTKFLKFVIKDNGVGIPKDEQGKIFGRFARGSNVIQLDPGGGTGLGLYIAKAIIEQNGGKIWFESEEGKGTTFYFTLPFVTK